MASPYPTLLYAHMRAVTEGRNLKFHQSSNMKTVADIPANCYWKESESPRALLADIKNSITLIEKYQNGN